MEPRQRPICQLLNTSAIPKEGGTTETALVHEGVTILEA